MLDEAQLSTASLFDSSADSFVRDPYSVYRRLRESDPVHKSRFGFWVVSRYADVEAVLRDDRFGRDYVNTTTNFYGPGAFEEVVLRTTREQMIFSDPPDHTRLRRVLVQAFSPRRVETLRSEIERCANALIDEFEARGRAELISEFARPIPLSVICEMVGMPEKDREPFLDGSRISERAVDPRPMTRAELDQENERTEFISQRFRELCERRRREPRHDLATALMQAVDERAITLDEAVSQIVLLFVGGHFTTLNLIGNGLLSLHQNPDQLALLRSDPSLLPNAVEELLRYETPVQTTGRIALEDAIVGGVRVTKGKGLVVLFGAANRDPDAFTDPDRLDITRDKTRGLSFGRGIHHCLGAHLGRLEGAVAIGTLLRRLPTLELDEPANPRWLRNVNIRGLEALHARW